MSRALRMIVVLGAAMLIWPCAAPAASVESTWSSLKRKIRYGSNGEFKGTLEEGNQLLAQIRALIKEAKDKNPALADIITKESRNLTDALSKNKMIKSVEQQEQKFDEMYEKALACQEKVKAIEQEAQKTGRLLTQEELTTIDGEWESCLKIVKTLKGTIQNLRRNCNRLSGDYTRKWDDLERKVDQLRGIAEKARDDLKTRRKATR